MSCPFTVGQPVVFTPSTRTRGLYQDIERFGMEAGKTYVVREIREDLYVYTDNGVGGWPWNEFSSLEAQQQRPLTAG